MGSPFDGTTYNVDIAAQFSKYPYPKAFQRVQELLDDQKMVDLHLIELEKQIQAGLDKYGEDKLFTPAQAMYDILREKEDAHGFVPDQIYYVTGVLSVEEFYGMMRGPVAFLDPFVTNRHGAETHRIQWWIIARDIEADTITKYYPPKTVDDKPFTAGALFASTADESAYNGKEDNIWYLTLDALQGKCTSARAPESFKEYISQTYKLISLAEEAQMKWDDCVKWRYAVIKGNALRRNFPKYQELVKYPKK